MDFEFSEEERIFQENLREYLQKTLRPKIKLIDNTGIPRDFIRDSSKYGIWAMPVSEEVGGQGASFVMTAIASEEIGRADFTMATAVFFLLESGWGYILDKYGNEELRKEVLPNVTSGKWFLGISSTEATGGSDIANIRTLATKRDKKYLINGQKMYVSGVMEAKEMGGGHLTLVKTNPQAKHKGISMLYVPTNSPGLNVSKLENMGRMGISTGIMTYDNVEVPERYLVGEENNGFYYSMDGFNHARVLVGAACLGSSEAILDMGLDYIKQREAFGSKLKDFQSIAFEASELKTRLEMARLLVYKTAWMLDHEEKYKDDIPTFAAMSKLVAPQVAFDIVKSVMMWMGAYGYSKDAMIEMAYRGIMSYLVGAEGALNVMKLIISKRILM
ncbi:acyl-CoA dehydrogenase [Candidatus Acidianus copahuensis]|uniref:Acyl-CoA dehydrogenase n=1 Tax=Candidatus Acidianus copahuensis TaxID=1160895 RepID=A0A031LT77_9CREN|nr:acyl-CoA dehydrogenase family protein [Candidatus Acidianus copahuensis]EZQ10689.1 acyl-CoA dehydrogenase [Candidatus Acidianus copahuensis]